MTKKIPSAGVDIDPKYIKSIKIGGMSGRMLHLPPPEGRSKKILFLHGQHASIERMYSTCQFLNEYGEVYQPDMPGFGGMTSFYKVGLKPSYDNYADFLYTFMKSHKLTRDVTVVGMSLGSQVMTRMFQKHPDSVKWVSSPMALAGFGAGSDFIRSNFFRIVVVPLSYFLSTRIGAWMMRYIFFGVAIPVVMPIFSKFKAKMQHHDEKIRKQMKVMETTLWRINDHLTHGVTAKMMVKQDLRKFSSKKIPTTLHNIVTINDQFFDNKQVAKTMSQLYENY